MINNNEKKEDLRIKRTRMLLSTALLELLEHESIDKISIMDICEKAMVHRTTFYKHFNDKYDLFEYVVGVIQEDIYRRSTKDLQFNTSKDLYMNIANITFDFIAENKESFRNMLKHNDSEFITSLFFDSIERAIQYLIKKYEQHSAVPISVVSNFYAGGFISLGIWWLQSNKDFSKQEMLAFIDKLIDERVIN